MAPIKGLLDYARKLGASDLHLTVGERPHFRKGGDIGHVKQTVGSEEKLPQVSCEDMLRMIREIADKDQQRLIEGRNEVDLSVETLDGFYRVNIAYQTGHPCITARVVPDKILPLERIGFSTEIWKDLVMLERGLVLVTGITGSGKSTTLASLVDRINETDTKKIITIEDPIEYVHKSKKSLVWQREIGGDTKSFETGVKYAMRQDPDVIMIGEIRDAETALAALSAAYSGHLVFSTLHTRDAAATIGRYIDFFPVDRKGDVARQLSETLEVVLSQQLLPSQTPQGRILAMEVLRTTQAVRTHINNATQRAIDGSLKSAMQTGGKHKMMTMDAHIQKLYEGEIISDETAVRYAIDKANMSHVTGFEELGRT